MKRPWIVAVVVMLACAAGALAMAWNLSRERATLREELAAADTALLERVQAAQKAKQSTARLAEARALGPRLLDPADLPSRLFGALGHAESASRTNVLDISFGDPQAVGGLKERDIVIKGQTASYDGLRTFLADLEGAPFALRISPMTAATPKAGAAVTFNMTLHLYEK